MTKKSDAPAIRFKGFSDAWEQRKVSELFRVTRGYVLAATQTETTKTDEKPYPVYSSQTKDKGLMGYYKDYLYEDAITWTTDGANAGTVNYRAGKFYCTNVCGVLLSNEVKANQMIAEALNSVAKGYVSYVGNPKLMNNVMADIVIQIPTQAEEREQLSSIFAKLDNLINQSILVDFPVILPQRSEQTLIGAFFQQLDNLITLHQRKFEKLTNVKKSMLEKMFPQNGSSYPEIRFKGFTDPWEQRKVGDLLIERNQQAPMSDEYPLMAFIANEGVAPKGERYDRSALVTDTVNKLYKKTEKGDFIYSSNNLETGSIGLNKYGKACISPVYSIFEPTGIADSDFLGRRLVRKDFINAMVKWRQGVIYGQWRIHESDFLKIEIPVPSVEEQRKIGAYLDQLDNLITLHQRELEKLQNIKKSMLEKMFV